MTNKEIFGRRLKAARVLKGLEVNDLVKELKINKSNFSFYERGINYPTVDTLIKLADLLDVSIDYLLGRSDQQ